MQDTVNAVSLNVVLEQRRKLLTQEFAWRKQKNSSYSQRAFARDLQISHALLSLVMSGKRKMSSDLAQRLLEVAGLPIEELEAVKMGLPTAMPDHFERLELEKFAMISDWSHYAVLSLLETPNAQWDPTWIAKKLGQSVTKAKSIMARLQQLGFIKQLESGRVVQAVGHIVVENKKSSEAAKQYNRGLLKKAAESMDLVPFAARDLSSTTFTLNPKYIPYAIERIRNFRHSLSNELENLGEQTDVYALTVQLFPLNILHENTKDQK